MAKRHKPKFSAKEPLQIVENKFAPSDAGFYNNYPEFSFKYYQHSHRKYSAKCIMNCEDFHTMFERLKSMSQLTWKNIKQTHQYHFHPIEWGRSKEPNGFKLASSDLKEVPAWQFKSFKECRIMGFFNHNNIFELIWIDRDHNVSPRH